MGFRVSGLGLGVFHPGGFHPCDSKGISVTALVILIG